MNTSRFTFRREDGSEWLDVRTNLKIRSTESISSLSTLKPETYVQEQWEGQELVRSRFIRLGIPDPCQWCESYRIYLKNNFTNSPKHIYCDKCSNTGITPRNPDPPWTQENIIMTESQRRKAIASILAKHEVTITELYAQKKRGTYDSDALRRLDFIIDGLGGYDYIS